MRREVYSDRREAGQRLAVLLEPWREARPLVLGLVRGGVAVGAEVARALGCPLEPLFVRKIGVPGQGELAAGAVVDVPTRTVQGYILVGKRSWGITLSRDERTLYVANGLGDDITIIDTASRKAVVSIPVGRVPWGIVVDD